MKNKGITLVALVVTVIILLILSGISIASLTGNGLFEKAKLAKEKQENAEIQENTILSDYENKIDNYINSNRNLLDEEVILWNGMASEKKEYKYTDTNYKTTDFNYILVTYSDKAGGDRQSMLIHKSQIVLSDNNYRFQLTGYDTRYTCFYFNLQGFTISYIDSSYMNITSIIGIK